MTLTLKPLRLALLAAAALGVAACSSEHNKQPSLGNIALGLAKARIQKGEVETAEPVQKPPQVTRAQMQALGRPVVFITVPRFGTAQPEVELAKNGAFRTYMGGDQTTVTLRNGVVTATRGLLVDLIGQDLSITPKAMFGGSFPKTYTRSQRSLTGEGVLATYTYTCALAPNAQDETLTLFGLQHRVRQYSELCGNEKRAFKNSYWVDRGTGIVWQSHQSVSKEVGHVIVQRVIR